tara:strand:+ start:1088 stop:2425 length:1338 start_codon:yes stop_codon:yes gene_type:complete
MGSNNFDGPVLLDSLALQRGYFGTGGRAIDESVGPRYSGGAPADPNGVLVAPQGSLHAGATTLWQNTDGASAWAAVSTGGAPSLEPYTGLMFVDKTYAGGSSNGSIAAPFITIQAALDAIGTPVDATDYAIGWTVLITAGSYDEDLVLPELRSLSLEAIGPSVPMVEGGLGPSTVQLYGPIADPRTITLNVTTPNPYGSLFSDSSIPVQIKNFELIDGMGFSQDALPLATASEYQVRLENVSFVFAGVAVAIGDCIRATGWIASGSTALYLSLKNCTLDPPGGGAADDSISAAGRDVRIVSAESTTFLARIEAGSYYSFSDCRLTGEMTFTSTPGLLQPTGAAPRSGGVNGFIDCFFTPSSGTRVFTSTAVGDCQVDATSFATFASSGWTLAGAATVVGSSNEWIAGNTPGVNSPWAAGGDNTLSNAVERMAALLFTLNGNVDIP